MADPKKFTPSYDFSDYQASSPSTPLPGAQVDIQLQEIKAAVDSTVDAIKDVRRSDGALKNGIVTADSLASSLVIGFTMRGNWVVDLDYLAGDGVVYDEIFYKARVAHASTAETRPDLDEDIWEFLTSMAAISITDGSIIPAKLADAQEDGFLAKIGVWAKFGALIAGGTAKTTPADADAFPLSDSADTDATKKLTWANLKAAFWASAGALTTFRANASSSSTLQEALDGGASGTVWSVALPAGTTTSDKVSLNTGYQTALIGAGPADTRISTSNTDNTQSILIEDLLSDRYYPILERFRLDGGATKGDGIRSEYAAGGIALRASELRIQGFSGSGKAGISLNDTFLGSIDKTLIFGNDIGIDLINAKGIATYGNWLADNLTWQIKIDSTSSGNWLHNTEIGLASLDSTKGAAYINGNRNFIRGDYTENFQKSRAWQFGPLSYSNRVEFGTFGGLPIYDEGTFNEWPLIGETTLENITATNGLVGIYLGSGDLGNLMPYSSYGQILSKRVTDLGATPPTSSVDTTTGYLDSNSLKLDWGTTGLSGVTMTTTFAVTAGQQLVFMFMVKSDRDLFQDELLQVVVRGAAGEGRSTHNICNLRSADGFTEQGFLYNATATESVKLSFTLVAAATHTALVTWIDDMTVRLDPKSMSLVENKTAAARSLTNKGAYSARHTFGRAFLDRAGVMAGMSGTVHSAIGDVATTAVTAEETLGTFTLPGYALDRAGQRLRIRAWGLTGANGNDKTIRLKAGSATLISTGVVTANAKSWEASADFCYISAASHKANARATVDTTTIPMSNTSPTINVTGSQAFTCTGQNGTASAGDIVLHGFAVEFLDTPGQ